MKINMKGVRLDLTPSIKVYIEEKIGGLAKYIKRFDTSGQPEVWVEITRTTRHHKKGLVYRAEANLRLPRQILRADHEDFDIHVAVDRLRDKLKMEIEKYKTSQDPKKNRGRL